MALPHKTKIPVGTLLAGKYKITREIGRGGMAAVYEAENVDIGKRIAIKVLAQELTSSAIVVERFLREARAAASIRSPYICDVYDSGRLEDGPPFLVLELLEGESLYEKMTKVRYLDVETTVMVLIQTCRGLTKAHAANIVHRDLKPENIFVTKDEEGSMLAKILDFGLAKFYAPLENTEPKQARLTREGAVFGTPAYMSPEQVRGQGGVDHRADLWALGCIGYECLTGKTVWATDQGVAMTFAQIANAQLPDPQKLRPDLPDSFGAWFRKALDRDIKNRFQTAKEFAEGLVGAFQMKQSSPSFATLSGRGQSSIDSDDPARGQAAIPTDPASLPGARVSPPAGPAPGIPSASGVESPSNASKQMGFAPPDASDEKVEYPGRKGGGFGRAVVIIGGIGLVGGLAYAGWLQFGETGTPLPTSSANPSGTPSGSAGPDRTGSPTQSGPPLMNVPWMAQVRDAQQAIANDDLKSAQRLFKEAGDKSNNGMPKTLLEHLNVAAGEAKAACRLTGLTRPRTYDLATAGSRSVAAGWPTISAGPKGPLMVWTDSHEGSEHAWAVLLDAAMRPTSNPVDVTPEAQAVGRPILTRDGDRFVLTYWDAKGTDAGVKVRFLDGDGHPAGAPQTVGPNRGGNFWPDLAKMPDGGFLLAYTDETQNAEDLFLRKLKPTLEPNGDAMRATELASIGASKPHIKWPSVAIEGGAVQLVYRFEKDPNRLIHRIKVSLADIKGLDASKTKPQKDRFIGDPTLVNGDRAKADSPAQACGKGACFVVWQEENGGGAWIAGLDPSKPAPMWHHKFSRTGARPSVDVDTSGHAQVVWFEGGKLLTATVNRENVEAGTKFARMSGDQQAPSIATSDKAGEWYVAWLDYETGHLEAYGARVQCK